MRAHACIIIIICTRTCFTHDAAYIVAIGLHRATMSYPSRDFSAARNIFCLNLKRTAFGNVKTTLGLVLAALQVILVPSTNVRRIAHSLIHEPFKERLLLTRLREAEKKKQGQSGVILPITTRTTPPSGEEVIRSQASIARSNARVVDRVVVHRHLARAHTSPPPSSSPSSPSTRTRRHRARERSSISNARSRIDRNPRRTVAQHRRPSSSRPVCLSYSSASASYLLRVLLHRRRALLGATKGGDNHARRRYGKHSGPRIRVTVWRRPRPETGSWERSSAMMGWVCRVLYVYACR